MIFFWAFVVGGLICVIGQIMFDVFKLTPAHTLTIFVIAGAVLDGLGLYEPLIDFAGAGATVPITSFGNSLVHGAMAEAEKHGLIGVITGIIEVTSAGISAAIIFGVSSALNFKSKGLCDMTDGSQVKSCYSAIKSAEATLDVLAHKTQDKQAKQAFQNAQQRVSDIKDDLKKQVIALTNEEPQY